MIPEKIFSEGLTNTTTWLRSHHSSATRVLLDDYAELGARTHQNRILRNASVKDHILACYRALPFGFPRQ